MPRTRAFWRLAQTLLIVAAIAIYTVSLVTVLNDADPSVALAAGDDEKKKSTKNKGDDDDEDHVSRGQVLEINTLKDPPELQLAGVDGVMLVRVLKTDEVVRNGVRLGDHVTLHGEKLHEQLFEATEIEVTRRCCRRPDNDNS